jgi:hypothetical protein
MDTVNLGSLQAHPRIPGLLTRRNVTGDMEREIESDLLESYP